jgi:excinuclease ABC subunit C
MKYLQTLTTEPGIYQMLDLNGNVLYIGKARNLKKRVSSYFKKTQTTSRIASLVKQIHDIKVIVTRNENEALLLENQLIKEYVPPYNILLRDDKSYPYVVLSHHEYPRLFFRRGEYKNKDDSFGPYPSSLAVRETVKLMQKIFKLRTCEDTFFRNRSRPCILYQIGKCKAPCVNNISYQDYLEDVRNAKLLLQGKNQEVVSHLVQRMDEASQHQKYEEAGIIRDQIIHLRHIQTEQVVTKEKGNRDVFAVVSKRGVTAVEVLLIREGRILGSQTFYPEIPLEASFSEILSAFIPQYYLNKSNKKIPEEIIVKEKLSDQFWLETALNTKITNPKWGDRLQWILMAERTGEEALKAKFITDDRYIKRLESLQELLNLDKIPEYIMCFDISHMMGEATIGSCVVFDQHGPFKKYYRKLNISNIQKGDDYAAMEQAVERIFLKSKILPDVLFIDGGKGQLTQAEKIREKLNLKLVIVAIAKGEARKPGLEQLYITGKNNPLDISSHTEALHLIQQIRDEAHRFAITGHRKKRAKTRVTSVLEAIPGIGKKRRSELLNQLGGLQEIKKASIEQLQQVKGINLQLAEKIYRALH